MESHVFLVTTTLGEIKAQSLSEVSTRTRKRGENLPSQRFRMIQSKFSSNAVTKWTSNQLNTLRYLMSGAPRLRQSDFINFNLSNGFVLRNSERIGPGLVDKWKCFTFGHQLWVKWKSFMPQITFHVELRTMGSEEKWLRRTAAWSVAGKCIPNAIELLISTKIDFCLMPCVLTHNNMLSLKTKTNTKLQLGYSVKRLQYISIQKHLGMINRCPAHKTCQQSVNVSRFHSFPIKIPKFSAREHGFLNLTSDGFPHHACKQENFRRLGFSCSSPLKAFNITLCRLLFM